MTHYSIILERLREHGAITSWEAIKEYGNTRLSDTIFRLRKSFIIDDEWVSFTNRYGVKSKFKKYIYKGAIK